MYFCNYIDLTKVPAMRKHLNKWGDGLLLLVAAGFIAALTLAPPTFRASAPGSMSVSFHQ